MTLLLEDALDPDLPIIDPHHHLYDRPQVHYLFEELLADTQSGHNIRKTVYIETTAMSRADGPPALRPVGETEFVNGIAARSASGLYGDVRLCAGIIGFADLALGDGVAEVLVAHVVAGGGRFRGIRQATYWDADESIIRFVRRRPPQGLMADRKFRAGFAQLAKHALSFDALMWHPQLGELIDLARASPQTSIILNHVASPLGVGRFAGKQAEVFEAWRADMAVLATCPNVTVKLGGFGMELAGFAFAHRPGTATSDALAEAWAPYVHSCIDQFGPDRCMFESNFPVDRATCSYVVIWNAFKKIARRYSAAERTALFHDTAARFYRLA